jgi:hypothetical protein
MNQPITQPDVEQVFIDFFTDNLTREEYLVADFEACKITITAHHISVTPKTNGTLEPTVIWVSNLKDIEYSSGMLIFHLQVGYPVEVSLL